MTDILGNSCLLCCCLHFLPTITVGLLLGFMPVLRSPQAADAYTLLEDYKWAVSEGTADSPPQHWDKVYLSSTLKVTLVCKQHLGMAAKLKVSSIMPAWLIATSCNWQVVPAQHTAQDDVVCKLHIINNVISIGIYPLCAGLQHMGLCLAA